MATWTNATKNTNDWKTQMSWGAGLRWQDATQTWADMTMTWTDLGSASWANISKNTASWSGQSKS